MFSNVMNSRDCKLLRGYLDTFLLPDAFIYNKIPRPLHETEDAVDKAADWCDALQRTGIESIYRLLALNFYLCPDGTCEILSSQVCVRSDEKGSRIYCTVRITGACLFIPKASPGEVVFTEQGEINGDQYEFNPHPHQMILEAVCIMTLDENNCVKGLELHGNTCQLISITFENTGNKPTLSSG
jgi:hypothetical protein